MNSHFSRRHFLRCSAGCLAASSLASLARLSLAAAVGDASVLAPKASHYPARAKQLVFIFLTGGVSHLESFDPKPEINKYAGKSISETPYADTQKPERLNRREVAFNRRTAESGRGEGVVQRRASDDDDRLGPLDRHHTHIEIGRHIFLTLRARPAP